MPVLTVKANVQGGHAMPEKPGATTVEPVARPFAEVLLQQARGRTHDDLTVKFHELIASVQETGKAGKIRLDVDVKPMKGDAATLQVTATVVSKVPQPDAQASIFFVDGDGNLTRNDPRQMSLPLRDASERREQEAQ